MAERDAFGNEVGATSSPLPGTPPPGVPMWTPPPAKADATEAASTTTGLSSAPSLNAPSLSTPTFRTPSGLPPVGQSRASANRSISGRRGNRGGMVVSIIVAIVIIGIPLKLAFKTGKKALNSVTNTSPFNPSPTTTSSSATPGPTPPSAPSGPPTGLRTGSLVRPTALGHYVAGLQGQGRLTNLVVRPNYIVAETVTPSLRMRNIYQDYKGSRSTSTTNSTGFGNQPSVPLSKVDVYAPTRLVHHTGQPTSRLDYLVLRKDPVTKQVNWVAYYKNGRYYQADLHGRHVNRIS